MAQLRDLDKERGATAASQAAGYCDVYAAERAAMVFDVVASRRRDYERRVLPSVTEFRARWAALSLAEFAAGAAEYRGLGIPARDWATMIGVAAQLEAYKAGDARLVAESDDEVVRSWAVATEPIRLAPRLDPFVGQVSGIGPALFAYLRMRSGADAIKPDGRIRSKLAGLGFAVPRDDVGLILLGEGAAQHLGRSRLHVDQLLW